MSIHGGGARLPRAITRLRWERIDVVRLVLATVPAALLLPFALAEPVGHAGWNNRSIAGFFQTLAYLEWGPEAIVRVHPEESLSSPFHLHSLLATPFAAVGLDTGGRLVSVAAMALAAYWVGGIVAEWRTTRTGWLAAALLWSQPWVIERAYMWAPEALSIALTTGAVYYLLRYYESGTERHYSVSLALVALSVLTHLWEAVVGLPLVALSLYHRQVLRAAGTATTVFASVAVVWLVSNVQGGTSSMLQWWGVWGDPTVFLEPEYWAIDALPYFGEFVYLPAAIVTTIACSYVWANRSDEIRPVLVGTPRSDWMCVDRTDGVFSVLVAWLVAGLSIPVLLARGNVDHPYLIWGLVAPVTVATALFTDAVAIALSRWLESVTSSFSGPSFSGPQLTSLASVSIAVVTALYILSVVYGAGILTDRTQAGVDEYTFADESQRIGEKLRQRDIDRSELTFVGNWYQYYDWGNNGYQSDILFVYAGAGYLPEGRSADLSKPSPSRAHITTDSAKAQSEWCIVRNGDALSLRRCAELS